MLEQSTHATDVLCVASFFKGNDFIRECRRQGARVHLLTREKLLAADWARESLADLLAVPTTDSGDFYLRAAEEVARRWPLARVVALEEYDVVTAARIREHLCLPGLGTTAARYFQDKLAMRVRADEATLPQPQFVPLINCETVADFLARVPPPWLLKPRTGASAMGMRKLYEAAEVFAAIDELDAREHWHERAAHHLLEHFVPGDVYHVDSLVEGGRVIFANVERYGAPPFDVSHRGGVSTSHTIKRGSRDERQLHMLNRRLLAAFGFARGTTHAEFIKRAADGQFIFLEVGARVGGAYTVETIEAATGVNLWREWARLELATAARPYVLPPARADYGGIAISLAREEHPDTSAYDDPEIVYRVRKPWHVGLVVRAPDDRRAARLVSEYARRFAADFTAIAPAEVRAEQHL